VFGWVFAFHQVGAGVALGAGIARDQLGSYDSAWYAACALCFLAAGMSFLMQRRPSGVSSPPTADRLGSAAAIS